MKLLFTFSEKFQSMNLAMVGKGPGVEYWLVSFSGALWAVSNLEIMMSSATSGMITLISLARVSLLSSQDSLFLVWRMFQKINVFFRPLFLISSSSDFNSFRLVARLVISIVCNQFCVGVGKL